MNTYKLYLKKKIIIISFLLAFYSIAFLGSPLLNTAFADPGDANLDGKTNSIDIAKAIMHSLGIQPLNGEYFKAADINMDGVVDMKDVEKIVYAILGFSPNAFFNWSAPVRLDSANGGYPTLSYAPSGDLRVFYNIAGTPDKMYSRLRLNNETAFGPETFVYNDARAVDVHYASDGSLDLAVENIKSAVVLKSTDNGNTWTWQKTYPAADDANRFPAYYPLFFTEDDANLRLIYGYEVFNPVFGGHPTLYQALRKSDTWDAYGTPLNHNGGIRGLYENGDEISAVGNGVLYSNDNGSSFVLKDGSTIPEKLSASDAAIIPGGRLYLLHSYSYGPEPNNKHLTFTYSDDHGASWRSPQIPIVVNSPEYMPCPRFTVDGNHIVVIWIKSSPSDPNRYPFINCIVSEDGGQSWGPIQTIVSSTGTDVVGMSGEANFDIASYNGKITLVYEVKNGSTRKGVYLMEATP